MRTGFFVGMLLAMLCAAHAPLKAQNSMIFSFKDGTQQGNLLSSFRKVTFASGNLLLNNNDLTTSTFAVANIAKMTFGVYSGFEEAIANSKIIKVSPCPATDFIQLRNAPDKQVSIQIIRPDGSIIENRLLTSNSEKIDIHHLSKGLYFIRVNEQTIKFIKR